MNAKDSPLVEIDRGAKVGLDTQAYWDLPEDLPKRASYDAEVVVKVAEGVWTIGSPSIVNVHAVEGPDGLIVYDTGDNLVGRRALLPATSNRDAASSDPRHRLFT